MKVKCESEVAQSCLTLSDPMDCSLPGSSVHGIFKARVLEWGAIAFSYRGSHSSSSPHRAEPLFNALYATVLDSMAVMEFSFLILILIEYSQRNTEVFLPIGMLFYDILTSKQLLS